MDRNKPTPRLKKKPESVSLRLPLQDRDIKIIKYVYDYRFLTSQQINLLVPGSNQVILRRLQKLFHKGFLDRLETSLHEPMIYALGNNGADILATYFDLDRGKIDWTSKNREAQTPYKKHTLMIADFRINIELALKNKPNAKISNWIPEGDFKEDVYIKHEDSRKPMRIPVVPDSSFVIEDNGDELYFFLEADRSTMTNQRFLRKMKAYWRFWKEIKSKKRKGPEAFRVLTITKTEARKENLRSETKKADDYKIGSPMFWFTSRENYNTENPKTILRPIWQTPANDNFHQLLE